MSDDVAPSSGERTEPPSSGFLQGAVVAWDASAGTNQVRVRGAVLINLPSLLGPETGLIRPDDTVAVGKLNGSLAVFGRLELAGSAQRALGIVTDREDTLVNWSTDTGVNFITYPGGPEVSVYIGSSRRCRVDLTAWISATNGNVAAGFRVTGASTIAADYRKALWVGCDPGSVTPPGPQPYVAATRSVYLSAADGLNEGVNTFTMVYRQAAGSGAGGAVADREIAVQPF